MGSLLLVLDTQRYSSSDAGKELGVFWYRFDGHVSIKLSKIVTIFAGLE